MPTASTAQILGNNESFEPYTQNLYVRRVLSGEFVQVNRHLLRDLIQRGLWNDDMRMQLIAHNGSVQNLEMPSDLKELYKTVWEIKQRTVLDMAAARAHSSCPWRKKKSCMCRWWSITIGIIMLSKYSRCPCPLRKGGNYPCAQDIPLGTNLNRSSNKLLRYQLLRYQYP